MRCRLCMGTRWDEKLSGRGVGWAWMRSVTYSNPGDEKDIYTWQNWECMGGWKEVKCRGLPEARWQRAELGKHGGLRFFQTLEYLWGFSRRESRKKKEQLARINVAHFFPTMTEQRARISVPGLRGNGNLEQCRLLMMRVKCNQNFGEDWWDF